MAAKRAIMGFKGVALAPIVTDTLVAYETGAGVALQYAGQMSRTSKETKTDIYYDDDLYAQLRNVSGEDVELRMAEVPLARMEDLGLGVYDAATETLEADFNIVGKFFALRCVTDTVSGLPFYFNYRLFEITGVKFDNFATRKESPSVCEVIISGVFKKPQMASLKPWSVMQLKEDLSNQAACTAFLTAIENLPLTPIEITYDADTGTGTQTADTAYIGIPFTLPACTFVAPADYHFKAWQIGIVEHAAGSAHIFVEATEVTAVWEADGT